MIKYDFQGVPEKMLLLKKGKPLLKEHFSGTPGMMKMKWNELIYGNK